MRDDSTSFTSSLWDRPAPIRPPRHAAANAIPDEVLSDAQVPAHLTPLPDAPEHLTMYLASNGTGGLLKQRLVDLGFTPGTPIRLVRKGPRGSLIAVRLRDTVIALRSDEARLILVTPEAPSPSAFEHPG